MRSALWRKYWMETRKRLGLLLAISLLPGVVFALDATGSAGVPAWDTQPMMWHFLSFLLLLFLPVWCAGSGVTTTTGGWQRGNGADLALPFTLSLPLRRRTFFWHRSAFGLLLCETLVVVSALGNTAILAHFASAPGWTPLLQFLWPVLLACVPLYFFGALLSLWFNEMTALRVQIISVAAIYFIYERLDLGTRVLHASVLPGAAIAILCGFALAAGLAAITVWRLARRDF